MQAQLEAALRMGRQAARARMTSRCVVMRKTGDTVTVDGIKSPEWAAVHTDLPCRLVQKGSRTINIAGVDYSEATARWDVEYDTDDLRDEDHVLLSFGEWVDTVVKLIEAVKGDQRTARRLPVVEVPRPTEWG